MASSEGSAGASDEQLLVLVLVERYEDGGHGVGAGGEGPFPLVVELS